MTAFELKAWRQGLGLTQQEAADALGVAVLTYRLWEWGQRAPAHPRLVGLACRRLETNPEEIAA